MEALLPTGGFQLPFRNTLSRLYNDTKKSSDFVQAPVPREKQQDPDAAGLHRKLRIQKDRLVGWGLAWSDPAAQTAEIDESLSRAGLCEVVASIMATIKDTLAEAEQLWLSGAGGSGGGGGGAAEKKDKMVQWDRARFEDLVNDFTASVDTLYDLSRARGAAMRRTSKGGSGGPYKAGAAEARAFEPTRIKTPQVVDPAQLTEIPPTRTDASPQPAVVLMSKTTYAEMARGRTIAPWGPLLLEYAPFDAIYAATGIAPPMTRFERLSAGLVQQQQQKTDASTGWSGLPLLLGYFEDVEHARFGLVYRFPAPLDAAILSGYKKTATHDVCALRTLLADPAREPPLEAKFRLAHNLASTVLDMHGRGVTHGKLTVDSVLFCGEQVAESVALNAVVDVRRPLISSFDVFSEAKTTTDPQDSTASLSLGIDERVLELHALAVLLLSVGLWTSIETPPSDDDAAFASAMAWLEVKCGGLYAKAVRACHEATVDSISSSREDPEAALAQVQTRVGRFLETCCILDGVSGWEERLDMEVQQQESSTRLKVERQAESSDVKQQQKPDVAQPQVVPLVEAVSYGTDNTPQAPPSLAKKEPKPRLYSQVPLPAEAVEKWNAIVMPQVNQALRHFYRKHPESVEISLESIGLSPQQTEPTVLVVCSSVGKVRAILHKRVGDLFDGSTGFALKVCRGRMVRSRASSDSPVRRSMATTGDDEVVEAANPKYQQRPGNGASIGAWIGDRHLPPVSFGGLVVVDGRTYGMTVHHMLDDPDRDDVCGQGTLRSAAYGAAEFDSTDDDGEDGYELSDTESEAYSDTDITSEYGDESDDDEEEEEPGDIPGIEPGCGDGYVVTQPALDDVQDGFYPCAETEDEDHLDTFFLGPVYASSGIRRRRDDRGLVHEVDWALFQFNADRLPSTTLIQPPPGESSTSTLLQQPTTLAPSESLPGKLVRCVARTSGAQRGTILPALCSVKIYGRVSPSHAYQVASSDHGGPAAMGIPGDSGAWVVGADDGDEQLCGHVLAWSARKRVAYICPMDVLLLDVARTLDAWEVRLPGGEPLIVLDVVGNDNKEEEELLERGTTALGDIGRLTRDVADMTMGVGVKQGIPVKS